MAAFVKMVSEPPWIEERYYWTMVDHWKSPKFLALYKRGEEGRGEGVEQAILAKRFSNSKESKKLHKHRTGEKQGERFHKVKRKAKEEARTTSTAMPNDLALMATVARGMSCRRPCYADMLRRVEVAVSSISDSFDEHIRQFTEQNHSVYTPPPAMLDLVKIRRFRRQVRQCILSTDITTKTFSHLSRCPMITSVGMPLKMYLPTDLSLFLVWGIKKVAWFNYILRNNSLQEMRMVLISLEQQIKLGLFTRMHEQR
ncbi:hypothetical protein M9H77_02066 [Catharanthus roseus]|uniref:Uncharacterized protein n=1 Tax=Catharanthus roseus TaxID=4058 RepID=A0ACC0C7B3_CATRO|nr:hypothetical protein M9H77_02066 [Catharanthus roseus]